MIWMNRYWNSPRQNVKHRYPHRWRPKLSTYSPGHIGDRKNDKPGGFNRFDRWQKLPVSAWKLYWRHNASTAKAA